MTMDNGKALRNYPEWISKPKREKGGNVCEKAIGLDSQERGWNASQGFSEMGHG